MHDAALSQSGASRSFEPRVDKLVSDFDAYKLPDRCSRSSQAYAGVEIWVGHERS